MSLALKKELREVFKKVDTLFSLINTLPLNVQEEAISEIKERLRNKINELAGDAYGFESEESNATCIADPFSEELDENGFSPDTNAPGQLEGSSQILQNCSSPVVFKQCEVKLRRINEENSKFEKPSRWPKEAVLQELTCQYSKSCRQGEQVANSDNRRIKKQRKQNLVCTVCNRLFHTQARYKTHMNGHSGTFHEYAKKSFTQKYSVGPRVCCQSDVHQFKCPKRSYRSFTESDIEEHISTHTKQRNYMCSICDKSYFTNTKLKDHISNVHNKAIREICEMCGFATHSKDIMRRHRIVKHTNKETFRCPICNATIKQKGTFLIHMRTHTGERPCSCKECPKTFRSRSQLASHMRMHREGKFVCETCSRRFRSRSHLQRHVVIHTGAKPYSCHLCSYECNVRTNITKHVRSVHGLTDFTLKKPPAKYDSEGTDMTASHRGLVTAKECLKKLSAEHGSRITVQELQQKESKSQGTAGSSKSQDVEAALTVDKEKEVENSSSFASFQKSSSSTNFVSSSSLNEDIISSGKEKPDVSRDILLDAMKLLTPVSEDDEPLLSNGPFLHKTDQTFEIDSSAADNLNTYVIQIFYNETASNSL